MSCSQNLGIFYSVGTSIHSGMLGVSPGQTDDMYESVSVSGSNIKHTETPQATHHKDYEPQQSDSGSVFSFLKNSLRRLGMKFGYLKRPNPHPDVVHDFQDESAGLYPEYQCMAAGDQPVLSAGVPVTVRQPEDCQKFFTAGQTGGFASVMEPPVEFVQAARTLIKSKGVGVYLECTQSWCVECRERERVM